MNSIYRENVGVNIHESAENHYILFRFIELHRLMKNNLDKSIKLIDNQEEKIQIIYFYLLQK